MSETIQFKLNGENRRVEVESGDTLLEVLREKLGVKSPKIGCERGDCGACTVLLDGKTVRSCLVLAMEADGREVVTIEGLAAEGLTDLQKAFVERNAFQCGFCAPGMTLAAAELLDRNPRPNREEVKEAISGNLCRCTGYEPIVDAVLEVSQKRAKASPKRARAGRKS